MNVKKLDDLKLVKMSLKGQLVVPQDIREAEGLKMGERFVAFPIENGVLFKRVELPKIKLKFKTLAKEIEKQFKKRKIKKREVKEAVKWAKRR